MDTIETEHGVKNHFEEKRRIQRIREELEIAKENQRSMSSVIKIVKACSQRSAKFIRWLRSCLKSSTKEACAVIRLRDLYAKF